MMIFGLLCLVATTLYILIVTMFDMHTIGWPDNVAVAIGCVGALIMIYCMLTSHPSIYVI